MRRDVLFLGTGIMGGTMARRIRACGFPVTAWNRSAQRATVLASAGIVPISDLRALMVADRVIIAMVSTGEVVDDVLFGHAAGRPAVEVLTPGSTVIVMSSIPVERARAQANRLRDVGIRYLDAPVSGGETGATAGTLSIMVGGNVDDVSQVNSILAAMGTVTHVGPVGTGQLAKLANQLVVGIGIGALAEALVLAELGGADPRAVHRAMQGGFADSAILRQHGERMLASNFCPGAYATTQLKDLTTALEYGERLGGRFPILALCTDLYRQMCQSDRQLFDHSGLYVDARKRGGLAGEKSRSPDAVRPESSDV